MDLEEMKERWAALNDRLERTEMLQESVIRELVQTKGEKSVSRLINWETFGFVVTILIIPYSIYVYHRFGGHFAMWDLFIVWRSLLTDCLYFGPAIDCTG